jgi:hypothetical protein
VLSKARVCIVGHVDGHRIVYRVSVRVGDRVIFPFRRRFAFRLAIPLQHFCVRDIQHLEMCAALLRCLRGQRVVRAHVRPRTRILREAFLVEFGDRELRGGELGREGGAQGLARAFAVPAAAFGVGLVVFLLVDGRDPLEGRVQAGFGDLVVVVEEALGLGHGIGVIGLGRELVGVLWTICVSDWRGWREERQTQARSMSKVGTTVCLRYSAARRMKRWYLTIRRWTVDMTFGLCSQSSLCIFCTKVPCRRTAPTRSMPKTLELSQ